MGSAKIYYFSGTGNSLHIAWMLNEGIEDSVLVPIVNAIEQNDHVCDAEVVGFVYPIYFTSIPAFVHRFIEDLEIESAKYIFAVASRIGTFTIDRSLMKRILKKKGRKLDLHEHINMTGNSPTGLVPGKGDAKWVDKIRADKVRKIEESIKPDIDGIIGTINMRKIDPSLSRPDPIGSLICTLMHPLSKNTKREVGYVVDDSCTGCGTCERVCPSGKVIVGEQGPIFRKDVQCFYCFACFNFCPEQAILVDKKWDRKDGRYHHPDVTVNDIAGQK